MEATASTRTGRKEDISATAPPNTLDTRASLVQDLRWIALSVVMATILILQNALLKTTLRALEAVGSWDAILELSTTPDPTAAYSLIKSNAEFHLSIWKYSSPVITNL